MNPTNPIRRAWRKAKKVYRRGRTLVIWRRLSFAGVPRVFGNAMPKSGSHLLLQVLQGLCQVAPFAYVENQPVRVLTRLGEKRTQQAILTDLYSLPRGAIGWGYLPAAPEYRDVLTQPGWVNYFILRDPRDMVISQVYYATEMYEQHRMRAYYLSLPDFNARLKVAIQGVNQEGAHLPDIRERFDRFLGWLDCPGVLAVKFEALIADREGSIHAILDHLEAAGCPIPLQRDLAVQKVVEAIQPKKSPTFRKGRSGEWRNLFTDEHKQLFKQVTGDLLTRLGYEKDCEW
jgi:hypothetical protein